MNISDANEPAWQRPRYFVAASPPTGLGEAMSGTLVGAMAGAVQDAWGIAPVLTAGTAIGVAAAAGCGRIAVAKDEFTHFPLAVYAAMLSDPGTLKTSLLGLLSGHLKWLQGEEAARRNPEIASRAREANALKQALEKVEKEMATALAKGTDTTGLEAHAEGLAMQLEQGSTAGQFTAPFRPISFGSDSTPEAIVKRAASQGGRLALLSAEAGVLANLAGRYSDGDAKTEYLNSAFDGESYEGSRVSADDRDIPNPWATMVLAIQPDALNIMLGSQQMRSRGFLQRWLLFHAPRGHYRPRISMPTVDRDLHEAWDSTIARVWTAHEWDREPRRLLLPDDVKKRIEVFEVERVAVAYAQAEEEGNTLLMGWLSKIAMTTVRIAGVLTLLDDATATDVTVGACEAAIEFADLATAHADYLFAHGPSAVTRTPRYRVLEALVRGSVSFVRVDGEAEDNGETGSVGFVRVDGGEFSRRDLHRRFQDQAWCGSVEDVEGVLLDLASLGWVQHIGSRTAGKPGRPSDRWALHPDATTHYTTMTGGSAT